MAQYYSIIFSRTYIRNRMKWVGIGAMHFCLSSMWKEEEKQEKNKISLSLHPSDAPCTLQCDWCIEKHGNYTDLHFWSPVQKYNFYMTFITSFTHECVFLLHSVPLQLFYTLPETTFYFNKQTNWVAIPLYIKYVQFGTAQHQYTLLEQTQHFILLNLE